MEPKTPTNTPPTSATPEPQPQDPHAHTRAQMNEFFSKPIDPEFAAVDKWCDSALKLSVQADRLETEEVAFIQARENLDQREEHLVAAHEIGFKLLLEVVHALKGITEDDLGARLQNLLDQVGPTTAGRATGGVESGIGPFKQEATLIRREICVREELKDQISKLEKKKEVLEAQKGNLALLNAKMKKDNQLLKIQLRARGRSSMKLYGKLKSLEGKYEWLTEYANNLVGITREVVFTGGELKNERKQIRMVRELEL